MTVRECIENRRSIRSYTDEPIPDDVLQDLLILATKAPTGSYKQPWGFVVIQNKEEIAYWAARIKEHIFEHWDEFPRFHPYETMLKDPNYSVLHHAGTLVVIYGNTESHYYTYDCSLAAGTLSLAAYERNIGTCWVAFADQILNTKEFKERYHVPEQFELVAPVTMGYIKNKLNPPKRKPPVIFNS